MCSRTVLGGPGLSNDRNRDAHRLDSCCVEWAFTWSFWLNVAAGSVGLLLAFVVLRQGLPYRIGLPLVALLLLEAVQFSTDALAWIAHDTPRAGHALLSVALASGLLLAPVYLVFLMWAVPGAATDPLRSRIGRVLVWAYTGLIVANVVSLFVWDAILPIQPLFMVPFVWAVVAGVHALFSSKPGTPERRRGAALLLAFGTRDVLWLLLTMGLFAPYQYQPGDVVAAADLVAIPLDYIVVGVVAMLYFPAIVYAVLSGRIVDLDRRFRVGVTQTTAAAFVAVTFVVMTETVETLIDTESKVASVAVAVALAFLFRPIQMVAGHLTMRFFPSDDPDGADERRAFYAEQVRLARDDGTVTAKERRMLDDMAKRLGLSKAEAAAIEANG